MTVVSCKAIAAMVVASGYTSPADREAIEAVSQPERASGFGAYTLSANTSWSCYNAIGWLITANLG